MTPNLLFNVILLLWLKTYIMKSKKDPRNCLLAIICDNTATKFHCDDADSHNAHILLINKITK